MAEPNLISILIPVFNGADTIPRAIQSLLAQSWTNWEAIVVDDGSNDQTVQTVNEFQDERIRIISHPCNFGRARARQTSLDHAKGEYIAFLDADDFYHPEKLRLQLEAITSDRRLALVSCRMGSFDKGSRLVSVRSKFLFEPTRFQAGSDFVFSRAGSLIRRSAIGNLSYDSSLNYAEDTDFIVRVIREKWIASLPDLLYFYSEFESLTKKKMIVGSLYSLKVNVKHIRHAPVAGIRKTIVAILKVSAKLATLPLLGPEAIARQRGKKPESEDLAAFDWALGKITVQ